MNSSFEKLRAQYGDAVQTAVPAPEAPVKPARTDPADVKAEVEPPKAAAEVQPQDNPPMEKPAVTRSIPVILDTVNHFKHVLEEMEQRVTAMGRVIESLERKTVQSGEIMSKLDDLKQDYARQEKANIDILRDSKNFQASIRDQMQRELDGYHKLHASSAYAPILTEIAKLYVSSTAAIGYLSDERERRNVSEIVLEGILEILEDQGVVMNTTAVGERRPLKTCKTRRTVPTADQALHGAVAQSLNPSFVLGNQVLVSERVDTYVYDEQLAEAQRAVVPECTEADDPGVESSEPKQSVKEVPEESVETVAEAPVPEAAEESSQREADENSAE